jgi:hypothetical protein
MILIRGKKTFITFYKILHTRSTFEENDGKEQVNCRTEKDRGVRLNHRTAGTIAMKCIMFNHV